MVYQAKFKEEFVKVEPRDAIRQGDLFCIYCNNLEETPEEWGMVLTADCDIANNKMGQSYSYLPVIPAETYVKSIWASAELDKLSKDIFLDCSKKIQKIHKKTDPKSTLLGEAELRKWLMRDSNEDILKAISCDNQKEAKSLIALLEMVRTLCVPADPPVEQLMILLKSYKKVSEKNLHEKIKNSLVNLPSDYFFLTVLPGWNELGYLVVLRDVQTISRECLYTTISDVKQSVSSSFPLALRIGRLNDYLKFAITQQFAFLFSRIGLPHVYEQDCKDVIDEICEFSEPKG